MASSTEVTMGLEGLTELKFSKELEAAINEVNQAFRVPAVLAHSGDLCGR